MKMLYNCQLKLGNNRANHIKGGDMTLTKYGLSHCVSVVIIFLIFRIFTFLINLNLTASLQPYITHKLICT